MKYFAWDNAKNEKLRKERGIGCEDVVFHIERCTWCRPEGHEGVPR